ncbi:MAG: hypothetical protein P8123_10540, partial [bacterium]
DGGSTWTQATQDSLPAMWNVVVNSVADKHVPQLCYGRFTGKYSYIPDASRMEIPETGILLDCSGLTADTAYYVYEYDDSGSLAIEASTTVPTTDEGIEVKTGATTYRSLGFFVPEARISTYQAPIDVEDNRGVDNDFNRFKRSISKFNPFSGNTVENVAADTTWRSWNSDGDNFAVKIALRRPRVLHMLAWIGLVYTAAPALGIGVDTKVPYRNAWGRGGIGQSGACQLPILVDAGSHTLWPIVMGGPGAPQMYYYYAGWAYAWFTGTVLM